MITFTLFLAIMNLSNVQQNLVRDYPGYKTQAACQADADEWLKRTKALLGEGYSYTAVCIERVE